MVANHQTIKEKKKELLISSIGALSEAVCISALFRIWFLFHTVAIASLGFLRSESFRVLVFCNKKGNRQCAIGTRRSRLGGFWVVHSYVSSTVWKTAMIFFGQMQGKTPHSK